MGGQPPAKRQAHPGRVVGVGPPAKQAGLQTPFRAAVAEGQGLARGQVLDVVRELVVQEVQRVASGDPQATPFEQGADGPPGQGVETRPGQVGLRAVGIRQQTAPEGLGECGQRAFVECEGRGDGGRPGGAGRG